MNYTGVRLESFYCNVHTKNSEIQKHSNCWEKQNIKSFTLKVQTRSSFTLTDHIFVYIKREKKIIYSKTKGNEVCISVPL